MPDDAPLLTLASVASVRAGHAFRGAITPKPTGSVRVIQIRDVTRAGVKDMDALLTTEIEAQKAPDWVARHDVLFVARGNSPLAAMIDSAPERTVCAPHLFVVRSRDPGRLLPGFLAWQLNQPPAQRYFRQSAEGSLQLSIRRGVLENVPLRIPPLERQHAALELDRVARIERTALETLIQNRETELGLVAERLLASPTEAA